jgi:hypothetical protein
VRRIHFLSKIIIAAVYLCVVALANAESARNGTNQHDHDHAPSALPSGSVAAVRCRSGAFVEAAAMLNSIMEIAAALPADSPRAANHDPRQARIRHEIDVLLYIALKQAHDEVHCVQGVLTHGYDRSFREIIARATTLVRTRGLKRDVIALGQATLQMLDSAAPASAKD